MSKLNDLIKKKKETSTSPAPQKTETQTAVKKAEQPAKANPFANLKKKNEEQKEKKKVSFNLGNKKGAVSPAKAPEAAPAAGDSDKASASPNVASPAAPSTKEDETAQKVQEIKEAKEFVSDDQPDEMSQKAVAQLQSAIEVLKNSMDHKELVGEAIKNVMTSLNEHDFLCDTLKPEDVGLMVRGLRESYGTTIAKKSERKSKRAANAKDVDDVMSMLADTGFTL